jgi:2-keto-4-pentenoate hydratase/2-oxohepta-3-ene-1,7-dioic acid hydratase in catechol pathway
MRIANVSGRVALLVEGNGIDVARASSGKFSGDPHEILQRWDEFCGWAIDVDHGGEEPFPVTALGPPVPFPRQVFAIGMNYRAHASEIGLAVPTVLPTFTKFPTSITGPYADVVLPAGDVDWEAEVVVVIGREGRGITTGDAWSHVAGLTVGQDISDRRLQMAGPQPQQFSLAKSYPGFGPLGPVLVTPDEFDDPDDLTVGCALNGEEVQKGRTRDLIFPVPELIARLSAVVTLLPGDLIFTGTPPGVGFGRKPPRFLTNGDELTTYVTGIGEMSTRFVSS